MFFSYFPSVSCIIPHVYEVNSFVEIRIARGSQVVNLLCPCDIQLLRERLSDKVHATTPKGLVGGGEFTVFQRNLKENP